MGHSREFFTSDDFHFFDFLAENRHSRYSPLGNVHTNFGFSTPFRFTLYRGDVCRECRNSVLISVGNES